MLVEQFLAMLLGLSDTLLTGHYLSTSHLAAMGSLGYLIWLMHGMFSLIAIGATAMVARFTGAGDHEAARRTTGQAYLLGIALAGVAGLVGWMVTRDSNSVMGLHGESALLACQFLRALLLVLPAIMCQAVGIACLRGTGDMVSGFLVMLLINAVNLAVSWPLVLGWGPLPAMGWNGLILGTTSGCLTGGTVVLVLLLRGRSGLHIRWSYLRPDWALLRRLLWVGLPGGADVLLVIGCQLWFVSAINQLGDVAAAAHGVAIRAEALAYLPGVALQMAVMTLVGQHLGARDPRQAGRTVWIACLIGEGLMTTSGAIVFYFAPQITRLFADVGNAQVADQASPLLQTVSLAMPVFALILIVTGALRGAGDTRWPLVISLAGFVGVRIPAAYWLAFPEVHLLGSTWTIPGWGLGVVGAWYAMVTDLTVRAALLFYRFWRGRWKEIEV